MLLGSNVQNTNPFDGAQEEKVSFKDISRLSTDSADNDEDEGIIVD